MKHKLPFFLSLGCITHDLNGKKTIGGSSTYSAILGRNLGFDAAIVTSIGADFKDWDYLKGIRLAYQVGKETTTFLNINPCRKSVYGKRLCGRRNQYVTSIADRIKEETIPEEWFNADIVYVCPVLNEIDERIMAKFSKSMIGVAPQGWMRSVGERGKIERNEWGKAKEVLLKADFVIVSEEDVFREDIEEYVRISNIFVLTKGKEGAELYSRGHHKHIPAFVREEIDATGAGDVFGAAFLLRYYETRDAYRSAIFASCAASFVVEKEGIEGIPHKEEVMLRMKSYHFCQGV